MKVDDTWLIKPKESATVEAFIWMSVEEKRRICRHIPIKVKIFPVKKHSKKQVVISLDFKEGDVMASKVATAKPGTYFLLFIPVIIKACLVLMSLLYRFEKADP